MCAYHLVRRLTKFNLLRRSGFNFQSHRIICSLSTQCRPSRTNALYANDTTPHLVCWSSICAKRMASESIVQCVENRWPTNTVIGSISSICTWTIVGMSAMIAIPHVHFVLVATKRCIIGHSTRSSVHFDVSTVTKALLRKASWPNTVCGTRRSRDSSAKFAWKDLHAAIPS